MTVSRRDLLTAGAGLSISLAIGARHAVAQTGELIERSIPSSGELIPVVGIGARNYRSDWDEIATYRATLETFARLGGRLIDSAPAYGDSEAILGRLVDELGLRDELFLASKVNSRGRAAGIQSVENSLRELRADPIDLMQVHSLVDVDTQLPMLFELKAEGRIRYVGISVWLPNQQRELVEIIARGAPLDFIQVDYALDSRGADERLLPLAADSGIAVLVNLPFGRGRLFDETDGEPLPDWAADIDCSSWAQVFLKYVVSHPAVTCAIPGTTKDFHAVDNLGAARGRLPDSAMRRMMEQYIDELTGD
ncbi:MAG TPA: aldo/keto reductase [Gammaproteobacteria bacterium]